MTNNNLLRGSKYITKCNFSNTSYSILTLFISWWVEL